MKAFSQVLPARNCGSFNCARLYPYARRPFPRQASLGIEIWRVAVVVSYLHDTLWFSAVWWARQHWSDCIVDRITGQGASRESWTWTWCRCNVAISFLYEVSYVLRVETTSLMVYRNDTGSGFHAFVEWSQGLLRTSDDIFTVHNAPC